MMIAEGAGAACVGVPTALSLIESRRTSASGSDEDDTTLAVVLAVKGRAMYVHWAGAATGEVMTAEALMDESPRVLIADQFLPADVRAWAQSRGIEVCKPAYDPRAVAILAAAGIPTERVLPLYAREPEAVTRWRETHG
jgi:hypothetical protein